MAADRDSLVSDLADEGDRREFADDFLDSRIALQIKALRQQRGWTQKDLARRASMKQSQISRLENVNNSSWTVATLKRLAAAFDLPLSVLFESWAQLVDDSLALSREDLERPAFSIAHLKSGLAGESPPIGEVVDIEGYRPPSAKRRITEAAVTLTSQSGGASG